MKKKLFTLILSFFMLISAIPAYAHSGGTDAAGGHYDYNNESGLGPYHYHHGYPAHLHPNGICPYDSSYNTYAPAPVKPNTPPAKPTTPAPQVKPQTVNQVVVTKSDMKVYVNGQYIPSENFIYKDRVYIPIRYVGDSLNATINFDAVAKTATVNVPKETVYINNPMNASNEVVSTYLISSICSSDAVQTLFFIKDDIESIYNSNSPEYRKLLSDNIIYLKGIYEYIFNSELEVLYPFAKQLYNFINNAEVCLDIASGTISQDSLAIYSKAYTNVLDYLFDSLEELDTFKRSASKYVTT